MVIPDPITIAVVGFIGAVIGRVYSAWREDRHRFTDLKREKYASLIGLTHRHRQTVMSQRAVVADQYTIGVEPGEPPTLKPTDDIEAVVDEILLLAPDNVGEAADMVLRYVLSLSAFAYDPKGAPPHHLHGEVDIGDLDETLFHLVEVTEGFRILAREDIGTASRWPDRLERVRDAMRERLPRRKRRGPGTDRVGR